MPLCARIVQTKWSQDVPELVTVAKRPSPSATAFTWEPRHVAVAVFDGSDAATSGSSPAGSAGTRCSLPRAATATLIVHDVLDDVELFRSTPCKLYKDGAFYFHAPRFRAPGRYRMVFQVACKGLAVAPCVTEHHVVLQRASADPAALEAEPLPDKAKGSAEEPRPRRRVRRKPNEPRKLPAEPQAPRLEAALTAAQRKLVRATADDVDVSKIRRLRQRRDKLSAELEAEWYHPHEGLDAGVTGLLWHRGTAFRELPAFAVDSATT